jgi:hypothetical protein
MAYFTHEINGKRGLFWQKIRLNPRQARQNSIFILFRHRWSLQNAKSAKPIIKKHSLKQTTKNK